MNNVKRVIFILFLSLFIVSNLINTVSAQENETDEIIPEEIEIEHLQNATVSEIVLKSEATNKDIIIEAQRSLDRSLSILNIVATMIGVLVALITIIVVIAIALGIFEYSKWKVIRIEIQKEANTIKELRKKAENDVDKLRDENKNILHTPLIEKPPESVMKRIERYSSSLDRLESLGGPLMAEDFNQRGIFAFYADDHKSAIEYFEKAIKLNPDLHSPRYNLACIHSIIGNKQESLLNLKTAIELDKSTKETAKKDKDFETLWDDVHFKKLVD